LDNFTPFSAVFGGLLIGLSICILLYFTDKVAGISSVIGGLFKFNFDDKLWRLLFLFGMILGALIWFEFDKKSIITFDSNPAIIIIGGLLTGFGTQLGSGCTSGHGVFGVAKLSIRSIVATIIFLFFGMLTVFIQRNYF
tara:strand:+ start:217 stop:633 length:417 start_codon:yes stop_codon:yes gene_type:complete